MAMLAMTFQTVLRSFRSLEKSLCIKQVSTLLYFLGKEAKSVLKSPNITDI